MVDTTDVMSMYMTPTTYVREVECSILYSRGISHNSNVYKSQQFP